MISQKSRGGSAVNVLAVSVIGTMITMFAAWYAPSSGPSNVYSAPDDAPVVALELNGLR